MRKFRHTKTCADFNRDSRFAEYNEREWGKKKILVDDDDDNDRTQNEYEKNGKRNSLTISWRIRFENDTKNKRIYSTKGRLNGDSMTVLARALAPEHALQSALRMRTAVWSKFNGFRGFTI